MKARANKNHVNKEGKIKNITNNKNTIKAIHLPNRFLPRLNIPIPGIKEQNQIYQLAFL
jgi:hypothetical protein